MRPSSFDEWPDLDRAEAEALLVYEATRCPGCGNDLAAASEAGSAWLVEEHVCQACAAKDIVERDAHARHAKDKPRPGVKGHFDGRVFYARPQP